MRRIGGVTTTILAAACVAPTVARAQLPPPVSEAIVPASAFFGGKNVAIGECAPPGMLGSAKPCDLKKGAAKFLVAENLDEGEYALDIEYWSAEPRPILLCVDEAPARRVLETAALERRWSRVGTYRLSGVFTTIEIESVAGFPAIAALRLTRLSGGDESHGGNNP